MRIITTFFMIFYNLMDFYGIYIIIKKLKFYLKSIKTFLKILKFIKEKKIKVNKISYFFKNLKKISKFINLKTIIPIVICLLFTDSLTICESENIIHHYWLNENNEFVEITDKEHWEKIKKEITLEELKRQKMEQENIILYILLIFCLLGTGFFYLMSLGWFDDDGDDFDDYDEADDEEARKEFFKKPENQNEIIYTTYLKKWVGKEERLRDRTNPFYIGTCTGVFYNRFDPEYVDRYNEFIREWEDDHIYKSNRNYSRGPNNNN